MLQPTCWTRSRTAVSHVPKNAILIIHTFDALELEIKTFIQPFANFIKGAHS